MDAPMLRAFLVRTAKCVVHPTAQIPVEAEPYIEGSAGDDGQRQQLGQMGEEVGQHEFLPFIRCPGGAAQNCTRSSVRTP